MARPLRLEFPGAVYHVTSRGDGREAIYHGVADRRSFLEVIGHVGTRFNWIIHAYCLMGNHYHLVVETPDGNLAQGMRQLNGVYTQRFNHAHHRVGHVFQGRYKAVLVDRDAYLLELARYVVLNPVRAGIVSDVADWPWSSYRATVGLSEQPDWLGTAWLLAMFAADREQAKTRYAAFVAAGVGRTSPWPELKRQMYLGSDEFVERMQAKAQTGQPSAEIPLRQSHPWAPPLAYFTEAYATRNEAVAAAYASGGYTMRAIAEHYEVHYSYISRIIRHAEKATKSGSPSQSPG